MTVEIRFKIIPYQAQQQHTEVAPGLFAYPMVTSKNSIGGVFVDSDGRELCKPTSGKLEYLTQETETEDAG